MLLSADLSVATIALNRFGLGATPNPPPPDPKKWLTDQFDRFETAPPPFAALPDARAMLTAYQEQQRMLRKMAPAPQLVGNIAKPFKSPEQRQARRDFGSDVQALYRQAVQARTQSALQTEAPFAERLVHFWSNHFCVSTDDIPVTAFAGAFERDAIRPHVLGRFEDMLLAVERHPAMLMYLNQNQSIGPDSPAGLRAAQHDGAHRRGLNENLAREIMELHTLGVRSGYTQADVTEFARAMTGWAIGGLNDDAPGDYTYHPQQHEPGSRTILGKTYVQQGMDQARAIMIDFARSPATANHIATKLARHFAGDTPPPAMVERLAAAFQNSHGDLPSLYKALIDSPEAWQPRPLKAKTPWEWTISALRGLGQTDPGALQIASIQQQLGQPVWKPGSPAGWDDVAASWVAPDALMRRVEFAQRLAAPLATTIDARQLGLQLLPGSLSTATSEQVARAESPTAALALLIISPDFLRR